MPRLPLGQASSAATTSPAMALEACPQGGAHQWEERLTYRQCRWCGAHEGQTPAEILGQESTSP